MNSIRPNRPNLLLARWPELAPAIGVLLVSYVVVAVLLQLLSPLYPQAQLFQVGPFWVFDCWDSGFYTENSVRYRHFAFPPMYSWVLGLLSMVSDRHPAAVVINLVSHCAFALAIVKLAEVGPTEPEGNRWVVFVVALFLPLHNVFFAQYSESLFVALTAWSLVASRRGALTTASGLAGVASLTRHMGVLLCAAIAAFELMTQIRQKRLDAHRLLMASRRRSLKSGGLAGRALDRSGRRVDGFQPLTVSRANTDAGMRAKRKVMV